MICYLYDDVDPDLLIRLATALGNLESAVAVFDDQLIALNHYR